MNSNNNLDIEVCLRPWVTLLPFYNFHTKAYEENDQTIESILNILPWKSN